MHAELPRIKQCRHDDHLADRSAQLRLQVIDQQSHDDPQDGARQHRKGDHQAFLRMRELQVSRYLHRQRAEDHPDHEGQIEVKESGEQGGHMPGLQEGFLVHEFS